MLRVGLIAVSLFIALALAGAATFWKAWAPEPIVRDAAGSQPQPEPAAEVEADPLSAIDAAIRKHDSDAIRRKLAQNIDLESVDAEGETLLNKAVLFGTPEIVDLLLRAGADPDAPGKNGLGPLAVAALAGHHDMLQMLMDARSRRHAASAASARFEPPQAAAAVAAAANSPRGGGLAPTEIRPAPAPQFRPPPPKAAPPAAR
ncbi:MAG: ankyrin repeat domain-containing protein [Rhodospirillales bacterium]|nr:ankyrin repeat domain-containing protein [Rhodospirillales bacterium]